MCGGGEPNTSPWPLEDEKLLQPAAGKRRACAACRVHRRVSGVSGRHPDHAPRPLLRDRRGGGAGAGSVAERVGAVCVGAAGNEGRTGRSGSHVDEPSTAHLQTPHVRGDGQAMRLHAAEQPLHARCLARRRRPRRSHLSAALAAGVPAQQRLEQQKQPKRWTLRGCRECPSNRHMAPHQPHPKPRTYESPSFEMTTTACGRHRVVGVIILRRSCQ